MQIPNKTQTLRKSYLFLSKACTCREHINISNNSNNNNNNNNNNNPTACPNIDLNKPGIKYWVDVQQGIVSSHGERHPL